MTHTIALTHTGLIGRCSTSRICNANEEIRVRSHECSSRPDEPDVSDRIYPPATSLTSNLPENEADSMVQYGGPDFHADLSPEVGPICKPISTSQLAIPAKTLRSVGVSDYKTVLTCIAHRVGRIKSATNAGTAQTRIIRCDTVWCGSAFDWRTPLRRSSGLLGPAYNTVRT